MPTRPVHHAAGRTNPSTTSNPCIKVQCVSWTTGPHKKYEVVSPQEKPSLEISREIRTLGTTPCTNSSLASKL